MALTKLNFTGQDVLPSASMPTDSVLQVKNFQTGAVNSGAETIPFDDTIPQITEGKEYMTLAFTPTSATSYLRIEVVVNGALSAANDAMVCLFVGTTANALNVSNIFATADWRQQFTINHYMTAGTTSELTFRVRAGGTSGTFTFNGNSGVRRYGGTFISSITIQEIAG
tara:strand:+ start:440 stop:946 length:507 start_codon:yes stop_codon:yes gene_type:complete